jgi:uncharacterized radical SAM superfamily Fe-S cluster-containing enzyme
MSETESICPICQKKLRVEVAEENGKVIMTKKCSEHGVFRSVHWQSLKTMRYAEDFDLFKYFDEADGETVSVSGCPYMCSSCESHVSDIVIGVIDLTKRCNLKCSICFATFPEHEVAYEPSKEEIVKILTFLSQRNPKPPAILFSGGEPLMRSDIAEIISAAHQLKFMTILATNGLPMAKSPELAAKLKKSGLNIVYLQFDSLDDGFYEKIRGKKLLADKLKVVEICRKYDIEIILVTTLIQSFNDVETGRLIRFAAENTDIIRGLIFQPVAFTGRATDMPDRENHRSWRFAEDTEAQTGGEIAAADLFPLSVMVPPIKIMSKFMKKPWPLFSCSPYCGLVNWVYVSKDLKLIPINHFVDFKKFFKSITKTAQSVESKGKLSLLSSLFIAAMQSLNWPLVTKEIGFFTLMKTVLRMHVFPSYASLGPVRRRVFLLGCMAFMDSYNLDLNRLKRCVIHYATPDLKIIPFCAYNNIHRVDVEEKHKLPEKT